MKNLFCVLVIATLALLAQPAKTMAQDAASRPIEIPSPTLAPAPAPEPTTPAPPLKTPEPTAAPAVASSPEPSQASPAEKTKPKKKAARVKKERVAPSEETTTSESEEKPRSKAERLRYDRSAASQLKALEQEWEANFTDSATVNRILADDFVGTSPGGKLMTKQALLREAREGGPAPKTTPHDLEVHFYGNDVAVVTGRTKQVYHDSAGRVFQREFRFTDTWVQRAGQWRCVASQSTLLPSG
jgi:hypothetical protein